MRTSAATQGLAEEARIAGDRLLKPQYVSKAIEVPLQQIYKLARSGRLPFVKIGRSVRFRESDVAALMAPKI